jgi:hypothetical protein
VDQILDDIERQCAELPGGVVLSGDITSRADANILLDDGLKFVRMLSERLHLSPDYFVIVPGNHDIALKEFEPTDYSHETPFRLFLQEFYGKKQELPGVTRLRAPSGKTIDFLRINSVRLRRKESSNYGYVQWSLYDDMLDGADTDPEGIRCAVIHHHLISALREEMPDEDYIYASVSTIVDSGSVMDGLQRHGYRFVMHGHQHMPGIIRSSRGSIGVNSPLIENFDRELVAISAGSTGAKQDRLRPFGQNSFNIIRFDEDSLFVDARAFSPSGPVRRLYSLSIEN